MTMPNIALSSLAAASTLPQIVSALGLPANLTPDQVIALLQAVADLRTSAAIQRIGDLIDSQEQTTQRVAGALETAATAQTSMADSDAKIAANTTPATPAPAEGST